MGREKNLRSTPNDFLVYFYPEMAAIKNLAWICTETDSPKINPDTALQWSINQSERRGCALSSFPLSTVNPIFIRLPYFLQRQWSLRTRSHSEDGAWVGGVSGRRSEEEVIILRYEANCDVRHAERRGERAQSSQVVAM